MMKQRRSNWTFSLDNPTARARTIGRGCWTALARVDPEAAEKIRAKAAEYGEDVWLTSTPDTHVEGDDMTRQQVAERAGVDTPAVVAWGRRGIRRKGCTHYLRTLPGKTVYAEVDVNEFLRLRDTPDVRAPRERPLTPCRSTRSATSRAPSTPPVPAVDRRSTSTQKA